jgi:hypothetical protein
MNCSDVKEHLRLRAGFILMGIKALHDKPMKTASQEICFGISSYNSYMIKVNLRVYDKLL